MLLHLTRMPSGTLLGEVLQMCNENQADPGHVGEITYLGWLTVGSFKLFYDPNWLHHIHKTQTKFT